MPTFISMFQTSGLILPTPTRILLTISDWLTLYWYIFIGIILLFIVALTFIGKTENGRLFYDTLKIRIPGIRNMNIKIITSRFTRTLSTLLSRGIPLLQALDVVGRVVGNKLVENQIKKAGEDIKGGTHVQDHKGYESIPPMVDSMIRIGEESGALDDILYKTADFYDEEVEASMEKITTMLEPVLIVIMALVIGFIVIAMALPMFDMVGNIEM